MTERVTAFENRGDESPAQGVEALSGCQNESISMDFHVLRQGFSPLIPIEQTHQHGNCRA